jgi:hypothetical protein
MMGAKPTEMHLLEIPQSTKIKRWEMIADNLKQTGWTLDCVGTVDTQGRTIWIVDAYRDRNRFVMRAYDKLTAFVELERAVCINLLGED